MFSYKLSENTEVRLLEERHAQQLTDLIDRNREYLREWLPWVDTNRTVEDRKNFIRGALKQFAQNKGFVAGIWHEGRLAGVIGYDPIDWENRTTALGYWIGEEFQGHGLVTAASRALIDHAFLELKLNRVSIACATDNKRSCAIPERLGFRREGVQREAEWLYDHFVDHVVYAALASEWQRRCSQLSELTNLAERPFHALRKITRVLIVAEMDTRNAASISLAEALGFEWVGTTLDTDRFKESVSTVTSCGSTKILTAGCSVDDLSGIMET